MRFKAVALGVLVVATSAGAQLPVAPPGRVSPADDRGTRAELAEAMRENAAATEAVLGSRRDLEACRSAGELLAVLTRRTAELTATQRPAIARVLAGIRPVAATPAAAEALAWVAGTRAAGLSDEAAGLLKAHHLLHRETIILAYTSRDEPTLWSEALLKSLLAAVDLPEVERRSLLEALAVTKQNQAEAARAVRAATASQLELWRVRRGPEFVASYRGFDIKAAEDEAVALFGELGAKYGPEKFRRDYTFADFAKTSVYEIRNLQVGQVAPDFTGEDFTGATYRLRQFRGKVVAVMFSSEMTDDTRKALGHANRFVTKFDDQPFKFVTIHSGPDRALIADALTGVRATWRTLWCDEKRPKTDVATAWNVHRNPMFYLLDPEGVIRLKGVPFGQELHYEVEILLAEVAAKK